ncbi:MAG: glycine cleavage system protein GcvH [Desulfobacterota bacterium]|nr:glycine cleavage system protein GcvH [Thermodesulfobacteriota bacterium]
MNFPEDLLYTEEHEWVRDDGRLATVGITDYAQSQLKDIVYVDLPEVGAEFKKGETMGAVESVKTVADVYAPVSGRVVEKNHELKDHPEWVNSDPYGRGWFLRMEPEDREELKGLLTAEAYRGKILEENA